MTHSVLNSTTLVVLVLFFSSNSLAQDARGTGFDLTSQLHLNEGTTGQFAQLFIPEYFTAPEDGNVTLVFHLHGASWAAENEVWLSRTNAVLVNIHLGALSSPYRAYFSDRSHFGEILDTVVAVLHDNNILTEPHISRLIITSFSAGYAGVREILAAPGYYGRINALILADGLHTDSDSTIMQTQMRGFLSFAKDAAAGHKVFLFSHSSIRTDGYESTTSTADYLISNVGAVRQSEDTADEIGTEYYRAAKGLFLIRGYAGDTAGDHMKHLHGMHLLLEQALRMTDSVSSKVQHH